jgi:YggT family protein
MEALIFLINTIGGLYITIVLLRLLLQLVKADFYNPLSQFILKATSPLVIPTRKIIPPIRYFDTATLLVALILQIILIATILLLVGQQPNPVTLIAIAGIALVHKVLDIYLVALLVVVILSWVAPYSRHPAALVVHQLTQPVVGPFRKAIPAMGGLDFSVMIVLLIIYVLRQFIVPSVGF